MPDFNPDYAPATGDVLSPAGLNNNWYRVASGKSVYEIADGHIESANFDPAFEIQPHHVRPGQAGDAISVGQVLPMDYFSDLWMDAADDTRYIPIVGAAITFYQKYDVSAALFTASGFVTGWRQFGPATGAWATRVAAPNIKVKAFMASGVGGRSMIGHTERKLPQSVFFNSASTDPAAQIVTREQRVTRNFNILHPRVTGGTSPCGPLAAGWHTFGLAVLVNQNLTGQDTSDALQDFRLRLNGAGSADARPNTFFSGIQRLRIYARNVSAVRLL